MNLKDLILEAGGVSDDVPRYRVEVARIDPDVLNENIYAESFIFEMNNDYSLVEPTQSLNSNNANFILYPRDHVYLRKDPFYEMQRVVKVMGAVVYPGEYAILNPSETIVDHIKRAGGLRHDAYAFGSTFTRSDKVIKIDIEDILKKPKSKSNIKLISGDVINIASKPNMIEVLGEVNSPGFYKFIKNSRVRDVIRNSGGYTQEAEKNDVYIQYPNGKSLKYSWYRNPRIKDGSSITVGKKPESEPFNHTEYAKELTSIIANLTQAISLILLVKN